MSDFLASRGVRSTFGEDGGVHGGASGSMYSKLCMIRLAASPGRPHERHVKPYFDFPLTGTTTPSSFFATNMITAIPITWSASRVYNAQKKNENATAFEKRLHELKKVTSRNTNLTVSHWTLDCLFACIRFKMESEETHNLLPLSLPFPLSQ